MKIRTLPQPRATWRAHFLAVAREAEAAGGPSARMARAGLKPRVRAMPSVLRSRVVATAAAA